MATSSRDHQEAAAAIEGIANIFGINPKNLRRDNLVKNDQFMRFMNYMAEIDRFSNELKDENPHKSDNEVAEEVVFHMMSPFDLNRKEMEILFGRNFSELDLVNLKIKLKKVVDLYQTMDEDKFNQAFAEVVGLEIQDLKEAQHLMQNAKEALSQIVDMLVRKDVALDAEELQEQNDEIFENIMRLATTQARRNEIFVDWTKTVPQDQRFFKKLLPPLLELSANPKILQGAMFDCLREKFGETASHLKMKETIAPAVAAMAILEIEARMKKITKNDFDHSEMLKMLKAYDGEPEHVISFLKAKKILKPHDSDIDYLAERLEKLKGRIKSQEEIERVLTAQTPEFQRKRMGFEAPEQREKPTKKPDIHIGESVKDRAKKFKPKPGK